MKTKTGHTQMEGREGRRGKRRRGKRRRGRVRGEGGRKRSEEGGKGEGRRMGKEGEGNGGEWEVRVEKGGMRKGRGEWGGKKGSKRG
ncbi:hypothetical protein Pmani_025292 [Petrolisthes manimaculis]|uniref:Uncharacterized protein n=1 Tax=Petrolisthes manimaculis TaxID=1843537 RepID=A0AAE1P8E3_9EUCA|nr:hypothetical protein Pmani_025292 [Petrolisthes manimaculis]